MKDFDGGLSAAIAVVSMISAATPAMAGLGHPTPGASHRADRHRPPHRHRPGLNASSRPSGPVPVGPGVPPDADGPNPPCCKR